MDLRYASPCAPNQAQCQGQDPKLPLAAGPPNETTRLSEGLISLAMQAYPHETDTEEQLLRYFEHRDELDICNDMLADNDSEVTSRWYHLIDTKCLCSFRNLLSCNTPPRALHPSR